MTEPGVEDYFTDFYGKESENQDFPMLGSIYFNVDEKEACSGIVVISNSCDIDNHINKRSNNFLQNIAYLPISQVDSLFPLPVSNTKMNALIKIIKCEDKTYFFLPPYKPRIEGSLSIISSG
jgi:hypothetical protein